MKLRIAVTVELTDQQVKDLTEIAKSCGHSFDGTKAPGKLIRRYLTEEVMNRVWYAHEHVQRRDEDENS